MSFKTGTQHYGLPQYEADDIPSWQQDITGAFAKLDSTLYNVADQSSTTSGKTDNLSTQVNSLTTTVTTNTQDIGNLNTTVANMDSAYKAADTQLSNRIAANSSTISQHTTQIAAINQQLDDLQPEPIEELKQNVQTLQTQMGNTDLTGIADGTVTSVAKQTSERQGIETRVNPDDPTKAQWRAAGGTGEWVNFKSGVSLGNFTSYPETLVSISPFNYSITLPQNATVLLIVVTNGTDSSNNVTSDLTINNGTIKTQTHLINNSNNNNAITNTLVAVIETTTNTTVECAATFNGNSSSSKAFYCIME